MTIEFCEISGVERAYLRGTMDLYIFIITFSEKRIRMKTIRVRSVFA